MSLFFKALERAEQERALRQRVPLSAPATEPVLDPPVASGSPSPAAAPDPSLSVIPARPAPSVFRAPRLSAPTRTSGRIKDSTVEIEEHLVSLLAPMSFEAEQYRALRHMIEQFHRTAELSVIGVSSPDAADGKTTTAINLAGALAQAVNSRVLIVDADFRGSNVAAHLGFDEEGSPGFTDAILDPRLTLQSIVQTHAHFNLSAVTAGRRPSAPYEVLKSPRAAELLAEARRMYDYVIVDTPPLVSVPDSRVIEKFVDGFLIVVGAHRTPRRLLEEALNLVGPDKIVGMVFNGDDRHLSKYTYGSQRRRITRSSTRRRQTALDE
jgi:capsular exopolysaccharide synthesis family protein